MKIIGITELALRFMFKQRKVIIHLIAMNAILKYYLKEHIIQYGLRNSQDRLGEVKLDYSMFHIAQNVKKNPILKV